MKNSILKRILLAGASASVLFTSYAASAQLTPESVPNSARPNEIERQNRIRDVQPSVGGAPLITLPAQPTKPVAGNVKFKLNGVKLEGSTVYGEAELSKIYADKIGSTITLGDLNAIADSITSYYRNHGYILSRAVVPPQKANGGIVTIRVVEGFVSAVKVQGDRADDAQIQAYAEKIRTSKPLDAAKLERYLLLMDDLPGVTARAVLTPSATTPDASEVVITVTRKRFEFGAAVDNRAGRYFDYGQASVTAGVNDLLNMNDQTQVRVANSIVSPRRLQFVEIRHEEPVGNEGTIIVGSASHVLTIPGYTLAPLDLKSTGDTFSLGVSHPLLRSRQSNWFINSDFVTRNIEANTFAGNFYYDKTRVLSIGSSYDFVDSTSAINRIEAHASKGLDIDTSDSKFHSRSNGDVSFLKFTSKASRIQPISGPWSVYGAVAGQYSNDPLYASEEFALGGSEFGSAYDSAELTGDSGVAARAEIQFNQSRAGETFLPQYQLYTFYDGGKVWNNHALAGLENSSATLSSAGIGTRFNLVDAVSGSLEGAIPIGHNIAAYGQDGGEPRVYFNLQYRY